MTTEKDPKTGKWLIQYRYKDWTGKNRKSTKRGFKTKREAEEWYRDFLMKQSQSCDMKFKDFTELYAEDMKHRLCEHTMINKMYVIRDIETTLNTYSHLYPDKQERLAEQLDQFHNGKKEMEEK